MRSRPPILHVIPFLWSGAGGVLTRLCEAQRRTGPVTVVTSGLVDGQRDWRTYRARLARAGVSHVAIDVFRRDADVFWSSIDAVDRVIRDLRPAVIHAHAGVPACVATIARARSGHQARIIGQMYSWGPHRPKWMDIQDVWGFSQTDRVVCSARAYRAVLRAGGVPARKIVYLPWGLPLDELPFTDRTSNTTAPRLGFLGRIEPRKGQKELVEAFALLARRMPSATLELAGPVADADYAAAIQKVVTRHRLGRSVRMLGEVRHVRTTLAGWDLFVSLSSDEGQGLAVLEAMALGIPVAARVVAGISDFFEDRRNGFAISGRSSRDTARTLANILADTPGRHRVAREARRLVGRRYDWASTVAAFERLYWE